MNRQTLPNHGIPGISLPSGLKLPASEPAGGLWRALTAPLRELFERWRREDEIETAIAHLRGLSDEQLRDMGIGRADIARVVRHGRDAR